MPAYEKSPALPGDIYFLHLMLRGRGGKSNAAAALREGGLFKGADEAFASLGRQKMLCLSLIHISFQRGG